MAFTWLSGFTVDGNVGVGTTIPGVKLVVADGPKASSGTLSNNSTLDIYGVAATSRTDSATVDMLRLHRAVTSDNKGSTFAIGLSYYADPGSNLPRTRVDFKTTSKTADDSDATNTVMSLVDSGNVGIGNTTPNYKLVVGTTFAASSDLIPYAGNIVVSGPTRSSFVTGLDNQNYGRMSWNASSRYLSFSTKEDYAVFADTLNLKAGNVGIAATSPGTFLQLGTYAVTGKYINQAAYPDIPSQHMMHITAPSTNAYYGGGISFGETSFAAANIVVRDAGSSGALDLCFGTGNATGVTEKMRIANSGAIQFNTYDSTNNTGTPTFLLGTDASGNVVKTNTIPGSGAGPYLPLAGGTMAGTITMNNNRITSIEELRFNNGGNIGNQINTDVDTGTETVANVAIATYTAAFFDFVVKKGTNVRSGTVYACHDGTNVQFTETSTQDLGDTSDVTLSVDISGTNMRLLATVTSDDWSVKSLIRAI